MDKDVFLDNKNIAVEQEVKNIKLQKCQVIQVSLSSLVTLLNGMVK